MPYALKLLRNLTLAGWKVRIHDAEGPEEPHVTIYKKERKWRLSLRTGEFLDPGDKWSQIDSNQKEREETSRRVGQSFRKLQPNQE